MSHTESQLNLDGVAIIGMSGRFPGAEDVEIFWQNLVNGVETIRHFKPGELEYSVATPAARAQGQKFVAARGVLENVDLFDAGFFGILPREAEAMDPQHRLFLECAWETLERGGYDPGTYGGLIGVYAGLSLNTYLLYNLCADRQFTAKFAGNFQVGEYHTMIGNDKDFLPTRVSYKLNLKGPSMAVQCACSTSLVAVCQASTALLNYQCDMALAGGVSVSFPQKRDFLYTEDAMVSADGTCRTFDANACGTVFGHGVGIVLLKRLADAVADGDPVLAVIKGTALNNDGSDKIGYAAPSVSAQAEVITLAQAAAGVDPESISYVEAHGTGTPLGDPIEVAALTQAFRAGGAQRNGYCALGSGKTHIGHLDAAAGVTGLIKTVLQLQRGQIPPLLHFQSPNPKIDFVNSPFFPVTKVLEWKGGDQPRRAGVSAFGVGGTNAHVIVEEAPLLEPTSASRQQQLLLLSAKTETALQKMSDNLAAHLESHPEQNLADVAFTLQRGRKPFPYRRAVVARDATEAMGKLKSSDAKSVSTGKVPQREPSVIFLFPGQGAQYVGMGQQLYETEPVFRTEVDRCADILQQHLGLDIRKVLYPEESGREEAEKQINETWVTQPSIFVIEYALAKLWLSWGVQPAAVVGHSIGEYVCAVLAETLTLEDSLALLATRAKLMQALPGGSMLAVRRGIAEVGPLLPVGASIAAVNSPNLCTVSGPTELLQQFQKALEEKRIAAKFLRTSHAFHSAMMEPMLPEFVAAAERTERRLPKLRWISTCTGREMTAEEINDAGYWGRQLRHSVRFADALQHVLSEPQPVLLEVGPGQTLSQLARQHPSKPVELVTLATLGPTDEPNRDLAHLLATLGKLWIAGVKPNWDGFYAGEKRRRVALPTYPFERKRFWIEPAPVSQVATQLPLSPPSLPLSAGPMITDSVPAACAPAPVVPLVSPTPMSKPSTRKERLTSKLLTMFEDLSGADQSELDPAASFFDLGYDSLFLTQVSQAVQSQFGIKVTFRQMMGDLSSLESLVSYLDEKLPADAFPESSPATVPVSPATPAVPTAAAPVLAAVPAIPSNPTGVPVVAGDGLVERVIQQQMAVMNQQLELLRQGGAASSAAPDAATGTSGKPVITAAKLEKEDGKRFGPFKAIDKGSSGGLTERQQQALDELVARYNQRTAKSKAHAQTHRQYFCDPRAAGNFRQLWKEMVYPIVCTRSKGSRIWDVDGNEYVDVTMGFGADYLGHSPDFVTQALEEQLKRGVEIGPQSPLAGEVAQMLCEMTGMERATFCNTGSEAIMAALRVSRTVTGRDKIVYFYGDYHGIADEVLGRPALVDGQPGAMAAAPGVPHLANVMVLEYGSQAALETIKAHAGEIAAVLVEPVQARHPDFQPREFLRSLRRITEDHEIAFIFDEVITGFRAAPGGAQEHFGIRADLATYGKVVGGGMPIGVLAGKAKFMDALDGGFWQYGDDSSPPTGVTFFAGTFVRHPLAMAAAHAVMKYLKAEGPKLQRDTEERTARFVNAVNAHFEACQLPMRLQRFSAMFFYDFHSDLKYAGLLFYYLRDRGVHIWEGRVGHFSTAHTDQDVEFLVDAFKQSVAEMQEAGFLPAKTNEPQDDEGAGKRDDPAPVLLTPAPKKSNGSARGNGAGSRIPEAVVSESDREEVPSTVVTAQNSSPFPLTDGQTEMWVAAQVSPEAAGPHHATNVIHLEGPIKVPALRQAIAEVIARHEALRSTFSPDGTEIRVASELSYEMPILDLSNLAESEREQRKKQILDEEGQKIFDLVKGPLFSFTLVRLAEQEHLLVFTFQMIVCDGWGCGLVLEDLSTIYSALVEGRQLSLSPVTPMRDYARWQRQQQQSDEATKCESYWLDQFRTIPPPFDLPGFNSRPPTRTVAGDRQNLRLSPKAYQDIKRVARQLKNTPFAVLLAAYQTWLHRLSGVNDLVVGVPFAGQSGANFEQLVGQCVHTLPLRVRFHTGQTFAGFLRNSRENLLDAQEHWDYSFGKLVQKLDLPRDASRIPLVSVIFNLDPALGNVQFAGCRRSITAGPRFYYQYDLGFNLVDEGETLLIECDYNRHLFDAGAIRHWLDHFQTLLESIVEDPNRPLDCLPLLGQNERQRLLIDSNQTGRELPELATIHGLVTAQAARTPEAVAVEYAGQHLTYAELDQRSNQLANALRAIGIRPDDLVAVCTERSFDMVVALLGILKAGGAYVPLDPALPQDRIAAILEDTDASILLTHGSLLSRFPETDARIVCLDEDREAIARESSKLAPSAVGPTNLAYVIYTSGSTGRPKGVEITHGAAVNFLLSMQREPGLKAEDVTLALTTLSFDIAVLEIWLPLTVGAKTVVVTLEILTDPNLLSETLQHYGITVMQATPVTWRMLLSAGWKGDPKLKVLCGGEALAPDLAERLLDSCDELWNMYGPTETTVWSSAGRIRKGQPITIGRPIANTQIFVLDAQFQPAPVGVPGELMIGGLGLAKGYRKRSDLTAEKFVSNPFSKDPAERLYRTGDLARYRPDGAIEFIGRKDHQVKLRGYRIELGEIESVLLRHPQVRAAVVVVREDEPGQARLAAYLCLKGEVSQPAPSSAAPALLTELRQLVRSKLPEYMLPSAFVVLESLPRTAEGKLDRRALPVPPAECLEVPENYMPPRSPTEERLARIWQETLKLDRVGVRDNFFDLGGQSLLAVRLFARIEREVGRKLPLATLFQAPTIEQLAVALSGAAGGTSQWNSLVPIQPKGSMRPLFLVHGAGGNVLLYRWLAQYLAPDFPLYGLQSRGLDGKSEPLATIEAMAAEYLQEIRKVQPKGPYFLGGYCLGGTVAYEMAQTLCQQGEEVSLVAMLDTYNFSQALKVGFVGFLMQKLRFHFGNFIRLRPRDMIRYVIEKIRVARDGELANLLTSMPGSTKSEGVARAESGAEVSVQAVNDYAADHYLPKPYPGRLTLFKPHINYKFYPDPEMGWGDLALGGLDIIELPVNPHAMLVEPYVRDLAANIKERLQRLQSAVAAESDGKVQQPIRQPVLPNKHVWAASR